MLLRKNKKLIEKKFLKGQINELTAIYPSVTNKCITITDKKFNIIDMLSKNFDYCNTHKDGIKSEVFLLSMISAKMKKMFAVTDVGVALTCPYALEKVGATIKADKEEIMTEGNVRNFIDKIAMYEDKEKKIRKIKESGHRWIEYFNKNAKDMIEKAERTKYHILDCVKIPVNIKNKNYELSTVINYEKEKMRGYKLGVLRQVTETGGMIEYVVDGTISDNDLKLVEEEILKCETMNEKDVIIMDRGFACIKFITNLYNKGITIVIPAKKNMTIYQRAKEEAIKKDKWSIHPNEKRKGQEIALVGDLKGEWILESDKTKKPGREKNKEIDVYIVVLSTDNTMNATDIIRTYELRTEIEEDFRQIKEQWELASFTSTKYNYIMCHIAMLLVGYNMFSMFKSTEEGKKYIGKCMKKIEKLELGIRIPIQDITYIAISGRNYGLFTFKEILMLYGECKKETQEKILEIA